MKKIIFSMMFAASAVTFGWTPPETALIDSVQAFAAGYATNQVFRDAYKFKQCFTNQALAAHIDGLLEKTPPVGLFARVYAPVFPKARGAVMAESLKVFPDLVDENNHFYDTPEKNLTYYLMFIDHAGGFMGIQKHVAKFATKAVETNLRRHLREQGKKIIVGPDGKDPCKSYIDAVTAALDAPMYEGLSNALSRCGIDTYVPPTYRSAWRGELLASETNKIFYGTVPFDRSRQWAVRFALGLEEYNRFVESYNGGSN